MKKLIAMVILITILLCGCGADDTKNWQTISIEDSGTIRIPNNWSCSKEENIIYIVDENLELIMVSYDKSKELNSNRYIDGFKLVEWKSNEVLSNEAMCGRAEYLINNELEKHYFLNLTTAHDTSIEFVVIDQKLSYEQLIKIAKTFVSVTTE